jgi:hypothetical protein
MWKRRWAHVALGIAMGTVALCLPLALQGSEALGAFFAPTISSLTPKEGGSAGGYKVIIAGSHFEEITAIHWGTGSGSIPMKIVTGTPTKGQCKVKSMAEIECFAPQRGRGVFNVTVTNSQGTAESPFTVVPQYYKNEVGMTSGAKVPIFGEGVITFETPEVELEPGVKSREVEIECINLMFGDIANEGTVPKMQGQVLEWWAMGHVPTPEHTETSALCRFTYLGGPGGEAWVTAERPLNIVEQEGEVCLIRSKHELSECPKKVGEPGAERAITSVIRSIGREQLTTPWNMEVSWPEGELEPHVKIGIPTEAGKSCEEIPAPPGCIRLTIIYPAIDLQFPFEGSVEPRWQNGVGNGLSPSSFEYLGETGGHLHVAGSAESPLYASGYTKILGANGRELLTIK